MKAILEHRKKRLQGKVYTTIGKSICVGIGIAEIINLEIQKFNTPTTGLVKKSAIVRDHGNEGENQRHNK